MDAAAELGRNSVRKQQIQAEYVDEQADAGRYCPTRLARPNSQAQTNADREISLFLVQLTTSMIDNLTRLILTLAICVTIQGISVIAPARDSFEPSSIKTTQRFKNKETRSCS